MTAKVSKIMIWPCRTIGLPNYGSAKLSAGVELTFDKPVAFGSKKLKHGFKEAREMVRKEFTRQYEPYKELLKNRDKDQ